MDIFSFTDLNALTQMKDLFPELTNKQFIMVLHWTFTGNNFSSLALHFNCSVAAIKQNLQRSRERMGLESLDMLRAVVILRYVVGLWKQVTKLA